MLRKDYYLILGIPRSESATGIRAAYRDLAKRHHPDVAGPPVASQHQIAKIFQFRVLWVFVISHLCRHHRLCFGRKWRWKKHVDEDFVWFLSGRLR